LLRGEVVDLALGRFEVMEHKRPVQRRWMLGRHRAIYRKRKYVLFTPAMDLLEQVSGGVKKAVKDAAWCGSASGPVLGRLLRYSEKSSKLGAARWRSASGCSVHAFSPPFFDSKSSAVIRAFVLTGRRAGRLRRGPGGKAESRLRVFPDLHSGVHGMYFFCARFYCRLQEVLYESQ
jgi:hypothetical protein